MDDESAVVQFIVQGDKIFVDENKDNIPQPEELNTARRLPDKADVKLDVTYKINELRLGIAPELVSDQLPQQLAMTVEVGGGFSYQQLGTVVLSQDPQRTNLVRFNGPVSLIFTDNGMELRKGERETPIQVLVGTLTGPERNSAQNESESANLTASPSEPISLNRISYVIPQPENAAPEVEIEFPTNDQPIVQRFRLDTLC